MSRKAAHRASFDRKGFFMGDQSNEQTASLSDSQNSAESMSESALQEHLERRQKHQTTARKITGWTRFIAGLPAVGLFLSAIVMAVVTFLNMIEKTFEFIIEAGSPLTLATEYIEYADIFLLAVVLYIMALGLFTLFVTDKIPLPGWLKFNDFDDLKERLVSVICVMLGVSFLGSVMQGASGIDLLWLSIATAVVVLAMTIFVKFVIKD